MTGTRTGPVRPGDEPGFVEPDERGDGTLLDVRDLSVRFLLGRGRGRFARARPTGRERTGTPRTAVVHAVTDVSFRLRRGEVLALVGESGCGKSVLASALLGLLPGNAQHRGKVLLPDGGGAHEPGELDLLTATERTLAARVRGRRMGLVPQSAASHLTPVRTARGQLRETIRALRPDVSHVDEWAETVATSAGLSPEQLDRYPHELSGGAAQRVGLALALAGAPPVLLADEPTVGLDRPLAERVADTLADVSSGQRAVLLITHDLAVARRVATHIAVMYASRIVELGPVDRVLAEPWHPYTGALLGALPDGGFEPIPGHPPELTDLPAGCAFCHRCPRRPGYPPCTGDPLLRRYGDRFVAAHPPSGTTTADRASSWAAPC